MTIDYTVLHDEIMGDPNGLGYDGKSDYDVGAVLLNAVSEDNLIGKGFALTEDVLICIDPTEYAALTDAAKAYLSLALSAVRVNTTTTATAEDGGGLLFVNYVQNQFTGISKTWQAIALNHPDKRARSRAEILFGSGTNVSDSDVTLAR